ncbi:hypothetical protein NP233_g2148 [Leucocoprinus birnbaumii]|uniref:F-box domain-containing protein n=1 Tax=Leucocoprinus birnbaumii TaxID=56174 RepID=A0AAD5W0T3_9AGAR|nr:hypothetical protein NP233_g2148 [Leucocoprinus birnbaumii]
MSMDGMTTNYSLKSGFSPESDLEAVLAEIRNHESSIGIIEEEIGELMRAIRQLQFRKLEHSEGIRRCKGLITLARRLPHEILAYIFEICVQDGYTKTPLAVSHVCSQWRKAASLPSVWSHVYVDFDDRDPCGRTRFWLARAGNSNLRITLEIQHEQSQLSDVMGLLLERRSQWRTLTINSTLLSAANRALSSCTGPFPHFYALSVIIRQEFNNNDDQDEDSETRQLIGLRTAFQDAPEFSIIHLARNLLPDPTILHPSITNLSLFLPSYHFTFNLTIESVLRVLEVLHNLETFSMILPAGQIRTFEPVEDTGRLVNLPLLSAITLTGWRDMYTLLLHLDTPRLRSLRLRSPDDLGTVPDEGTGRCLLQFLSRASPPLEELELRDADIPSSYLIQCLSHLSQLKTLRLHESEISDDVLRELYGPNGLCPELSTLDFRWCGYFRGRTLVGLVQSRLQRSVKDAPTAGSKLASTCITKVTVIHCSFVQARDIADLASLTLCQVVIVDADDYCREFSEPVILIGTGNDLLWKALDEPEDSFSSRYIAPWFPGSIDHGRASRFCASDPEGLSTASVTEQEPAS